MAQFSLTAVLAAAVILTGCVSAPSLEERTGLPYDAGKSRALNITQFFGDYPDAIDQNQPSAKGIGTTALWKAAGLAFISAPGTVHPDGIETKDAVFGYVPAALAPDADTARRVFVTRIADAVEKAVRDVYPKAKVRREAGHIPETWLLRDTMYDSVLVEAPGINCAFAENVREGGKRVHCSFDIVAEKATGPAPTARRLGQSVPAWYLPAVTMPVLNETARSRLDRAKVLMKAADYLPPLSYIYVNFHKSGNSLL